jgi:hypothetical protein
LFSGIQVSRKILKIGISIFDHQPFPAVGRLVKMKKQIRMRCRQEMVDVVPTFLTEIIPTVLIFVTNIMPTVLIFFTEMIPTVQNVRGGGREGGGGGEPSHAGVS